jgi:cobalamin biosynthesis protein CbiG
MTELKQSPVRSTQFGDQARGCIGLVRTCLLSEEAKTMTSNLTGLQAGPIVAGIGCTSTGTAEDILQLLAATLAEAGMAPAQLVAIASHERRRDSLALRAAAASLGVPLHFHGEPDQTRGVCEAAAAAFGPLLVGKRKSARVTCAIAAAVQSPSAAMASSTLATSWAGP